MQGFRLPQSPSISLNLPQKFWESDTDFKRLSEEEPERIKAWKVERAKTYDEWHRTKTKRLTLHWQIWTATKFKDEKEIFFPHNADWRGRIYPLVPYLNTQSDGNGKALLLFAKGKPLGDTGARSLAIHGANCFGEDKISMDERVQWIKDHSDLIVDSAENPLDGERFWMHKDCDKPFMFLAFCMEWVGYIQEGAKYVSYLPVASDGSCSGLQHYSGLLKDEVGGYYTNLIPRDRPADVYMKVAEDLQQIVAKDSDPMADLWNGKIDRAITKRPTMTFSYGASLFGYTEQTKAELIKRDTKGGAYLGDSTLNQKASIYLAKSIDEAISTVVIKAKAAMDWLKEVAEKTAEAGCSLEWITPSGMVVKHKYYETETVRINTFHGGTRIRLHVVSDTDKPDARKNKASLPPNFIHSLDASHLALTVKKCFEEGINDFAMIHDSFGCHASDMDRIGGMNEILRNEFIKMYSGDYLETFKAQIKKQIPAEVYENLSPRPTMGSLDLNQVAQSTYFFA